MLDDADGAPELLAHARGKRHLGAKASLVHLLRRQRQPLRPIKEQRLRLLALSSFGNSSTFERPPLMLLPPTQRKTGKGSSAAEASVGMKTAH
jgi:hypothetical protein